MKRCYKCGEEKPFSSFHREKLAKSGFSTYCKDCWRLIRSSCTKKHREQKRQQKKRRKEAEERKRQTELAIIRKQVCKRRVTPNHEFLLDLHWVLIESFFLRGRKNPFARIQFIETGTIVDDTHSTDL